MNLVEKIQNSIDKFSLDLKGKIVLTEAATGNYVVTSIIAAISGASVKAITRKSKFGSIKEVFKQTYDLAKLFNVEENIQIIRSYSEVDLSTVDILTNTGFNRPINLKLIEKLSAKCVIPLMWEPWEYREGEIDIEACVKKGIKVYGTNESDSRLGTMLYIGYIILHFLLENKFTPFSSKILIIGDKHFGGAIANILGQNKYVYSWISNYTGSIDATKFDIIIFAEHQNKILLLGEEGYINNREIKFSTLLIHIAGNVDYSGLSCQKIPKNPAKYGYMSFTSDYIDNMAVIDLHTAGLKVAEGMIKANKLNFKKIDYRDFMITNYPALAFEDEKYW